MIHMVTHSEEESEPTNKLGWQYYQNLAALAEFNLAIEHKLPHFLHAIPPPSAGLHK